MNPVARVLQALAGLVILLACLTGGANAADLSRAVILVASERLSGSPFEETVILAAPLAQGGHIGIVLNRPTGVQLATLFPEQKSTRRVIEPVYAGGPMLPGVLFAVTREAPADEQAFVPLMPGLVAVMDGATVDKIIETTPNDARYFVGLVVWPPEALDDEVDGGAWRIRRADANLVLRARSTELWRLLRGAEV